MNQQQFSDFSSLKYGFKAKIFKNSIFSPASIYLDRLYSNFLWISTDNNAFLIDLAFTTIDCYSLQLELQLKYESGYKGEALPRYLILKEFNMQVPIIFEEYQEGHASSEHDINSFIKVRKPKRYELISKYINQAKSLNTYSSNFSRYFKKLRLQLQALQTQSWTNFTSIQLSAALNAVQQVSLIDKSTLIEKGQLFTPEEVLQKLKIIYCRMNLSFLKSINKEVSNSISIFKKGVSFVKERILDLPNNQSLTCFQALMQFQDSQKNYLIPEYKVNQSLPLVDYFCFSSHNTYLTGNQLTSDCKVTRYIEDLKKGIKCVQLDVHNQGNNQPIITHAIKGKGFCKPISFRLAIQSMDEFLQYHPKHYPIILSIQNHATRQNQDLMNNILVRQFPKCIITPKDRQQYYTLQQAKGKIIIKTSCDLEDLMQFRNNHQLHKENNNGSRVGSHFDDFGNCQNFRQTDTSENPNKARTNEDMEKHFGEQVEQIDQAQNKQYKQFLEKISKVKRLKQLFNQKIDQTSYLPIQKIVQITGLFKAPKGIQTIKLSPFMCSSMTSGKIIKAQKQKIVTYTKQCWLRSYPEGTQIYSNNYNFLQLLARGVQIIALNTQTNDDFAIMMNGYFRAGKTKNMTTLGYIQKPQYLRAFRGAKNTTNNKPPAAYPHLRQYTFSFYTHRKLQFKLYSLQNSKLDQQNVSDIQKRVTFKVGFYNESFFIIKIDKDWVECFPLRFLPYQNSRKDQTIIKTIIGRDYQFEDSGIKILCRYHVI